MDRIYLDRRRLLKGASVGMLGLWASRSWTATRSLAATPQAPTLPVERLGDRLGVVNAGGTNVVALSGSDGHVLVDSGVSGHADGLVGALSEFGGNADVTTVFNTHYHLDHTGNNESLSGAGGATIIAHERTHQWMSTDYWLPSENRYEKARPKAAWPTRTFIDSGVLDAPGERIEYGYLLMAHTGGDMYVYFRDSNVLAVGDVASPVKDPELDWISGGWIGGRLDAMDRLLAMANADTRIVPGTGPVMSHAEFQAERDVMEIVRQRLFTQVRKGDGPREMLEGGVLEGLDRTWADPYGFLYAAARGLWGNHNKLDPDAL